MPSNEIDPYENDPGRWGASLINVREVLIPCLEASGARSVAEVGAYAGDLTGMLLDWAEGAGGRVVAIDPTPEPQLVELSEQRSELELVRETSHDALRHLAVPDAVIIDGDHNYYTVSEELRLIDERAPGADIPLLMFHDVGWPHARRDTYFAPERIPEEHRQPMIERGGVFPGDAGIVDGGLTFLWTAEREGGPRNGVLTAIEDFLDRRRDLRLAALPMFFGFGIVWRRDAPWAGAVAEIVEPWEGAPLLERLEANRVHHLATVSMLSVELARAHEELARLREQSLKQEQQEELLRLMLDSRAFALADRLSRVRNPTRAVSWRDEVRRVLGEDGAG
jgi:Methyltransferase domain